MIGQRLRVKVTKPDSEVEVEGDVVEFLGTGKSVHAVVILGEKLYSFDINDLTVVSYDPNGEKAL